MCMCTHVCECVLHLCWPEHGLQWCTCLQRQRAVFTVCSLQHLIQWHSLPRPSPLPFLVLEPTWISTYPTGSPLSIFCVQFPPSVILWNFKWILQFYLVFMKWSYLCNCPWTNCLHSLEQNFLENRTFFFPVLLIALALAPSMVSVIW